MPATQSHETTGEFVRVHGERTSILCIPERIPVFLIPGIFNHSIEMQAVAHHLNELYHGQRPIYVYQQHQLPVSYEAETRSVLTALKKALNSDENVPYLLAGYSAGASLAVDVAKSLNAGDRGAQVFVLDGAPAQQSSRYLNSNSIAAISDLINIINYAGTLSGLRNSIQLSESDKKRLFTLTLESRIERIARLVLNENIECSDLQRDSFVNRILYAKARLAHTPPQLSAATQAKVDKIVCLFTDQTVSNYGFGESLGWETECTRLSVVTNEQLRRVNHQDLLRNQANSSGNQPNAMVFAALLKDSFLDPAITVDDLFDRQSRLLQREYDKRSASDSSSRSLSDTDSDGGSPPASEPIAIPKRNKVRSPAHPAPRHSHTGSASSHHSTDTDLRLSSSPGDTEASRHGLFARLSASKQATPPRKSPRGSSAKR